MHRRIAERHVSRQHERSRKQTRHVTAALQTRGHIASARVLPSSIEPPLGYAGCSAILMVTMRGLIALAAAGVLMAPEPGQPTVRRHSPTPTLRVSSATRLMVIAPHPD